MKTQILILLVVVFLSASCNNQTKEKTTSPAIKFSENYRGPIIDMHIHAYREGHPMFGMPHPPTLRGRTYEGVASATEQKEKTLEKFHKHNIVKAIVSNGQLWFPGDKANRCVEFTYNRNTLYFQLLINSLSVIICKILT